MYTKVYYLIEVSWLDENLNKRIIRYEGKKGDPIPLSDDNIAWWIKEKGFDTCNEAYLQSERTQKTDIRMGFKDHCYSIVNVKIQFESYEEYLRVRS